MTIITAISISTPHITITNTRFANSSSLYTFDTEFLPDEEEAAAQ